MAVATNMNHGLHGSSSGHQVLCGNLGIPSVQQLRPHDQRYDCCAVSTFLAWANSALARVVSIWNVKRYQVALGVSLDCVRFRLHAPFPS